jgi:hypothetical protein
LRSPLPASYETAGQGGLESRSAPEQRSDASLALDTAQALVLHTDNLLYGRAVRQRPEASPVIPPCALGTTLTHGDEATSGTSVSLPGLGMESADSQTNSMHRLLWMVLA